MKGCKTGSIKWGKTQRRGERRNLGQSHAGGQGGQSQADAWLWCPLASTARPSQVEGASENMRAMPETMGTMSCLKCGAGVEGNARE